MTLFIVGIGLNDEKDVTVKGLEAIKNCDHIFLEYYTSKLNCDVEDLERFYGKKIIIADRDLVENKAEDTILKHAKDKNTAFLVIGDPMCATTHIDILLRAKKANIKVKIIHNASILTAIGEIGLELYKFGKTTSIPFDNENIKAPYEVLLNNLDKGLHTLFLLDLAPDKDKYLSIKQALVYLQKQGVTKETEIVACSHLGSDDKVIRWGTTEELIDQDFGKPPFCLIIPAKLHFIEQEALEFYKVKK